MSCATCKGCNKRSENCHVDCDEYRKFQEENEKVKDNRRKDVISRSTIFRANYHK